MFIEKVTRDFMEKKPTKEIKEVFEQEKEKYMSMEETAVEASVVKKYLEDLSKIPYSIKSDELYDLDYAEKALDAEHYGMKDVKDAILEIIAVGKLKKTLKGKIFCLLGGPGLGKTTIARSVATALGRKFYSISLGGVTDSSVLKGHRRTYVGAYAGKIIEALKVCETNNPVILLDEIDKMGSSYQGDPRS
jgi:ATP-dependent Lon protease